jgi:hypothetical protein
MKWNRKRNTVLSAFLSVLQTLILVGCSTTPTPSTPTSSTPSASTPSEAQDQAQAANSANEVQRRLLEGRAVEAVIWGMPIVSQDAQHQASLRDAGAKDNDIVFWSQPSGWKNQTTTPNASIRYVFINYNTQTDGPVVLDVPAAVGAGLFGTIVDAWQVPLIDLGPSGEDKGKGGKFLLLPPDFKGEVPAGYFPVRSQTYNGFAGFRAIAKTEGPEDVAKALGLIKQMRMYPLSKAATRPSNGTSIFTASLTTVSSASTRAILQTLQKWSTRNRPCHATRKCWDCF